MSFLPSRVPPKLLSAKAEVLVPATVKQPAKATRARKPAPAAAFGPVLKAARCLYRDVSPREAL